MRALSLFSAGCFGVVASSAGLAGCAGGTTADGTRCVAGEVMTISPNMGTANSAAAAPGNQVQFNAVIAPTVTPTAGCPLPAWLMLAQPAWTSSDAKDIQISSAKDATNGTAVCLGPTDGAATLTATEGYGTTALTATTQLTCK